MKAKRKILLLRTVALLGGLLLSASPAHAVLQIKWRIQGGYYIIQVYPDLDFPVDCQVGWQVTTESGFTRQGNSYGNNLPGMQWNEFMGPMTQDVTGIYPSANCQLSQRERDRRAQVEAQQRAEQERRQAIERQRQAQEQARQQAAEQARQAAARKQAEEQSRRAHTIQVPDYSDVIQKNEAARREQLQQRQQQAEEAARRKAAEQQQAQQEQARRQAAARQQEQERRLREARQQAQRVQQGQALMRQTDSLSQQMRQQAGAQDAALSQIASGGNSRAQGMAREADTAAQARSGADIHSFLQQRLESGQ